MSINRNDLIITFSDRVDTITIRGWSSGKLGITLDETLAAPPSPTFTFTGDYTKKLNSSDPTKYVFDPYSNYASDGAQAGAADILSGSLDGDSLQGLAGNDGLDGLAGDDALDGGEGDDLMFGGGGADTMVGGAGRDFIYGSGIGAIYAPLSCSDPRNHGRVAQMQPNCDCEHVYLIPGGAPVIRNRQRRYFELRKLNFGKSVSNLETRRAGALREDSASIEKRESMLSIAQQEGRP
jgi:hypothetical protein